MRIYTVAGHSFGIELEQPWRFMDYTPAVQERIERARRGEPLEVIPIRAGDEILSRTFIKSKADLPQDWQNSLDLSQYEPFRNTEIDEKDILFKVNVHACLTQEIEQDILRESRIVLKEDKLLPWFYVRMNPEGATSYEFFPAENVSLGIMTISEDRMVGDFYPREGFRTYAIAGQLNTAIMLMYTYATASLDTLLLHSSVVRHNGKACLFFGKSGTGKSTHARLWVENIPGCDLINDDNPVARYIDGKCYVYGSPWSGKTPCYRNTFSEIRALVRLEQAPQNSITQIAGLDAYASLLSSSSSIKWIRADMDKHVRMVEKLIINLPSYHLKCLPDQEAAMVCLSAVEANL